MAKHMDDKDRGRIEYLLDCGKTITQIAKDLGRPESTISREIQNRRINSKKRFGCSNRLCSRFDECELTQFDGFSTRLRKNSARCIENYRPDPEHNPTKLLPRGVRFWYADPYCSTHKPHIERVHEDIRRVLMKGTSFNALDQDGINLVMSHVNSMHKPSLGDCTPYDVFIEKHGESGRKLLEALGIRKIPGNQVTLHPFLLGQKFQRHVDKVTLRIDRRTNARVDDKSRRPHFCVCRRHLRENNRMHTASIGTARATLPAGSYLQPAFSAAHLRLVSPTARDLARRPDNSRIGAGSYSLGLVARATSRPSARRHSFRLCHAGFCEAAAVRSCRPPQRRRRATRSRAPHPSAQVPYRPCRSTRSPLPQRVRCSP